MDYMNSDFDWRVEVKFLRSTKNLDGRRSRSHIWILDRRMDLTALEARRDVEQRIMRYYPGVVIVSMFVEKIYHREII